MFDVGGCEERQWQRRGKVKSLDSKENAPYSKPGKSCLNHINRRIKIHDMMWGEKETKIKILLRARQ